VITAACCVAGSVFGVTNTAFYVSSSSFGVTTFLRRQDHLVDHYSVFKLM